MYYTPGHFFAKSATGCLVHHYSYPSAQFVENYTLDQFDENYTLENYITRAFFHILISLHGVSKQLRQRKLARSKRSFSEVLTTCKMSRGWKMRCELRNSGLVGRVALATMA